MEKGAWNRKLVVVGLSMAVVMNITTKPAAAAIGEVKSMAKAQGALDLAASD